MFDMYGDIIPVDHDCDLSQDCPLVEQISKCLGIERCPLAKCEQELKKYRTSFQKEGDPCSILTNASVPTDH